MAACHHRVSTRAAKHTAGVPCCKPPDSAAQQTRPACSLVAPTATLQHRDRPWRRPAPPEHHRPSAGTGVGDRDVPNCDFPHKISKIKKRIAAAYPAFTQRPLPPLTPCRGTIGIGLGGGGIPCPAAAIDVVDRLTLLNSINSYLRSQPRERRCNRRVT
jgi:hypothetical protein